MKNLLDKLKMWFTGEKSIFRSFLGDTTIIPSVKNNDSSNVTVESTTIDRSPRELLYLGACKWLGKDITPEDSTPDEYDCAETVNKIHKSIFGDEIGGTVSTYSMYDALSTRKDFVKVIEPLEGDIIISPTGYGNGRLSNGHVGIMSTVGVVMSNNSYTGTLDTTYTVDTWRDRYVSLGGFPMLFFRKI